MADAPPPFIPVSAPLLDGNEKLYLAECIDLGWISAEGPFVEKFERQMARRVGRRHAIAVANGSVALDAAVAALGLGPGDEVILPTFTIIACAAAIVRARAVPVTVDCDRWTWNTSAELIAARVTSRTRAIMVVHLYGLPVDMDAVLELARRHRLPVIEDAAEMLGQTYRGKACGSFGSLSTFSFYSNKNVTSGEGGMILTDDDELAARCRGLRNNAFQPSRRFVHESLGWNFRMSNLQAAVGVAQLERLDLFVARKRRIGRMYQALLADDLRVQRPLAETDYAENIYWMFGIVLNEQVGIEADEAIRRLHASGIGCRPFFWPMHEQPVFRRAGLFDGVSHPRAERIARRGLCLPSGLALTDGEVARVASALRAVLT